MQKTILIVEDDPASLKLARDVLQANGYRTLETVNGKLGVELAKTGKPDLILMDMQMPVMNGLEATGILKKDEETRDIPVIALTSSAMARDRSIVTDAGCDGYMTKPIDIHGFLRMVKKYLGS